MHEWGQSALKGLERTCVGQRGQSTVFMGSQRCFDVLRCYISFDKGMDPDHIWAIYAGYDDDVIVDLLGEQLEGHTLSTVESKTS